MFTFARRLLLIAWAVAAAMPIEAPAQRKAAPVVKAPPPPVAAAVRVKRGETVEIPLRIHGTRSQTLEFRIRAAPRAGKLSDVKQTEPEAASVTYTPPTDLEVKSDRFAYAVRSREGVSAAVDVDIAIVDAPAALTTPAELVFPVLPLGEAGEQGFEIVNAGGGMAEGELEIDSPWRIEGSRKYRLGAGERRTFKAILAPATGGTFAGEIRYTSQRDRPTSLRGSAQPPITFATAQLTLKHAPTDPARAGSFDVTNHTAEEQTLTFTADERLVFSRTIKIGPGATTGVAVQIEGRDTTALAGELRAEARGFTTVLPVSAAPVGAILRTAQPLVNFGQPRPGAPASATLALENIGGLAADIALQVAAPFFLAGSNARIEPGARTTVDVGFNPPGGGVHRAVLRIQSPSGALEVPVEARVATTSPVVRQTASAPAAAPMALLVRNEARAARSEVADAPRRVRVQQVTTKTANIEWPAALSTASRFRAEERRLSLSNDELKIDWVNYPSFTTEQRGDRIAGTFTGLTPGQIYIMRVVPAEGGRPGGTVVEVQFRTFFERPSALRVTPLRVLLLVLAGCAGLLVWQRIKQRRT